jgi:nucleotidyltransferase substrate binding protein (TIGR01987 family)
MMIDLSTFHKAISQVDEALAFCESDMVHGNPRLTLHLRAAAILAFEFTYELAVKTLKRFLEMTDPYPSSIDEMSFNDLIRRGYELGLLRAELVGWKQFRRDRGTTSHAYDEKKALDVFAGIPAFLDEAKFLYAEIKRRQETLEHAGN